MFWSKIWFFLIALVGAVALTIALVMPRPAQRAIATEEKRRLAVACGVVQILLEDDARKRVEINGLYAGDQRIESELAAASNAAGLDEARRKRAVAVGGDVKKEIDGRRPDLAILIDKKGRVVARVGVMESEFGDVLAGRPLVDDALAGYKADDLWVIGNAMYLVSASPVVKDNEYVGAVVHGYTVTNEFTGWLVDPMKVQLGFYRGADTVASTETLAFDHAPLQQGLALLQTDEIGKDCGNAANRPIQLSAAKATYAAMVARLPGEAGARGAFYAVFIPQPEPKGFWATLDDITKSDLGLSWILVGVGFVVVLLGGIGLMLWESDLPLRRLAADAVALAKGERERLGEDVHPGKFGSIARSVNINIDKLGRDAKTAKKDLDQLLGPAPEGSLGTIDLLATALPNVRPGGPAPAAPPPPSEFRFADSGPTARPATPPPRTATPPPLRKAPTPRAVGTVPSPSFNDNDEPTVHASPPHMAGDAPATGARLGLDDDILGGHGGVSASSSAPNYDPYFKQVFDQFVSVKHSCNEPTSGLTFEKFCDKLIKNRDDLMARTGCREVRFTVYVKDGKAALKASPVKDE